MDAIIEMFDLLEKAKTHLSNRQYKWYKEQIERQNLNQKVRELCEAEYQKLYDELADKLEAEPMRDFYIPDTRVSYCDDIYINPITTSPYHYVSRMCNRKIAMKRKYRIRSCPNSGHGFYNNRK